jgi:KaiC/GvpD/RAD55 family RecA-like ATPase
MDPLSVIRELSDLLAVSRGRVVFVNGGSGVGDELEDDQETIEGLPGAMKMVGAARAEAAKLLRTELGHVGIDVCEVVVGEYLCLVDLCTSDRQAQCRRELNRRQIPAVKVAKIVSAVRAAARDCWRVRS